MEEALGAGGRLWIRGRYRDPSLFSKDHPHWWERRRKLEPAPLAQLETRVGGQVAHADVSIDPNGAFDAAFAIELPPARRGWRLARNHLTVGSQAVDKCAIVITPPEDAASAVAVLLPLCTLPVHGACELERFKDAQRWTQQLQRWQHRPEGPRAFYYLACVPGGEPSRQSELALAATTLGWPSGSLILLPATAATAVDCLAAGIDRLRWLLAGSLELSIVNLEPSTNIALATRLAPAEDRSAVRLVPQPESLIDAGERTPALRPTRAARVLRHPVVFCHGLLAFSTFHLQVPDDRNC
jgi:hypothetical protein